MENEKTELLIQSRPKGSDDRWHTIWRQIDPRTTLDYVKGLCVGFEKVFYTSEYRVVMCRTTEEVIDFDHKAYEDLMNERHERLMDDSVILKLGEGEG